MDPAVKKGVSPKDKYSQEVRRDYISAVRMENDQWRKSSSC